MPSFPVPLTGQKSGVIGLDIRAMQKACEKMQPYQRGDCPICAWHLETAADGIIHCRFCGYQDQYPTKRDVYND